MAQDTEDNGNPSQRRIIISAVILAVIVISAVWFTLSHIPSSKVSPSPSPSLSKTTPTHTPVAGVSPFMALITTAPVAIQATPNPYYPATVNGTQSPTAVAPTSKTGPEDWAIPMSLVAMAIGIGYPVFRFKK
jgi:hypothetical protein